MRFASRIGCYGVTTMFDFSHMAAWTSMGIYSHTWLLRVRFLLASRLRSSLDLLCLCFFLLPRVGKGGMCGG